MTQTQPSVRITAPRLTAVGERAGSLWTLGVLVLIVAAFFVAVPQFHSKAAWVATSLAATEVILLSLGQTFVVVGRGIDLSVGANLGLSGMVSGWAMTQMLGGTGLSQAAILVVGAVVAVVTGTLVGTVNGLVVTRLGIMPLIATLGMMGAATGVTQLINDGQDISTLPPDIFAIGNSAVLDGWIPVPVLVTVVITAGAALLLHRTRFGRHCYGIGSNPEAAARTGIRVGRHTTAVYALAGSLAGVAGFLVMAQLASASVTAGQTSELSAIAAVVIGGVSLFGGRGNIAGAVIGTLIITVLQTGLVVASVSSSWQTITVGVVLVAAVFADQQRLRLARRT
ncbi:ABC transporter permease [Streptosporangium saharense]|uniref:Ribose transport system permease protein n=1 Tax=Streptosporangium saharense TaxID=1706840 RepID=A0A7W7VPY0_9ACTN|nr:ABC transporter permease [Streptosporangium saharense]MBB4918432.1 ribose transport system permease protein [Streptosporangium saharense]